LAEANGNGFVPGKILASQAFLLFAHTLLSASFPPHIPYTYFNLIPKNAYAPQKGHTRIAPGNIW